MGMVDDGETIQAAFDALERAEKSHRDMDHKRARLQAEAAVKLLRALELESHD